VDAVRAGGVFLAIGQCRYHQLKISTIFSSVEFLIIFVRFLLLPKQKVTRQIIEGGSAAQ